MIVRLARFFFAVSFAAMLATPALAQFLISVQQNGQAAGVTNGGTVTINAAAVGKSVSAAVTLTNVGATSASFSAAPQILGSGDFTSDAAPVTVGGLGSTTFHIVFNPATAAQDVSQFIWTFTVALPAGSTGTPVVGVISLNLVGTAPNMIVNIIQTGGNSVPVPGGGTFQFPATPVNSTSSLTIAISNTGSGSSPINSITATGSAFTLQGVPLLPLTLNGGSQLQLTAQFAPSSVGAQTGSLQISMGTGSYTASLAGTGTADILSYQLTQDGKTSALAASQTITMDGTNVGATSSVVVQFQNTGTVAVSVGSIGTSGGVFTITDGPFLPVTLQPQQSNTVTLTFAPTQPGPVTGRLLIGTDTFVLNGTGLGPLLQFSYQVSGGASVPVAASGTVSFPPIAVGQTESLQFTITNAGTATASVVSAGVLDTTGVFSAGNLGALPIQLAPNATTSFSLGFAPKAVGPASTDIVVNSQTFSLTGIASAPPALPAYHFTGASGTQQPFTQPSLGLSLNTAYPIALTGTLTITVASSYFVADPAVQFSTGGLQVPFYIPANTLQAVFPSGSTAIQLQTGTIAGTIVVSPAFAVASGGNVTPVNAPGLQLTVPAQAPTILAATAAVSSAAGAPTTLLVQIIGYTTTRSLGQAKFTFTASSGFTLGASQVTVDLTGASTLWFLSTASQPTGGEFDVEIPFNLGGGSSGANLSDSISGVSIVLANGTGSSNTVQVAVP
jgi:hypothetical protein